MASKAPLEKSKKLRTEARPAQSTSVTHESTTLRHTVEQPLLSTPSAILDLQRAYGNQAVQRLIQTKLTAAADGERNEQEAEPIAPDGALASTASASNDSTSFDNRVSRAHAPDTDLSGSFDAGSAVEGKLASNAGAGSPMPEGMRSAIEPHFGTDFSSVRLHTGAESTALNRQLGAKAFTHQNHIYLGEGASASDKRLMAHELTHVVQQGGHKSNRVQTKLVVGAAGDQYEQEADQVAERVSRSMASSAAPGTPAGGETSQQAGSRLPEEPGVQPRGGRALRRRFEPKPSAGFAVAHIQLARAGTIQRDYDALNSMGKSRVDALAEKKYAEKAQQFEFKMGPKIQSSPVANEVVDTLLMTLKQIVDAWAKATGKSQGEVYGREFGYATADKYYGAFEMTGANIQKVFDDAANQPMRAKLKVIYNAVRNNNLSKYLKLAALEMDRLARGKAPKNTKIRTARGNTRDRKGEFNKQATEKETVSSGFASDSGLDKILSGDRAKTIKSEAKKEKVKTGIFKKKHVFGDDKHASIMNWKDQLVKDSKSRKGNQSAGLGLDEQETLKFGDVTDMTDAEARLLYKRTHKTDPSDIELAQFKSDPNAKVKWEQGGEFYSVIPNSEVDREAGQFRARLEAGISGSTDLMMNATEQMGMTGADQKKRMRLALVGWMLANRDHSFYEVMKSATNFGVPFAIDKNNIGSEYESADNLYPMAPADFKDLLPEKQFPSYFLSKTYKATLATGLTTGDKDVAHFRKLLEAEGVPDSILQAVDEREIAEMMQLSSTIKDAGFDVDAGGPKKIQALRRVMATSSYLYLARAKPDLVHKILLSLLHTHHGAMGFGSGIGDAKDKLVDAGVPRNLLEGLSPKQLNDMEALRAVIQTGSYDKAKNKWSNQKQVDTAFKKLKQLGNHAEMARAAMMRVYHGSDGLSENQKILAGAAGTLAGREQSGSQNMSQAKMLNLAVPPHITDPEEKRKYWSVDEAKAQLSSGTASHVLAGLKKVKKSDQGPVVDMIRIKLTGNVDGLSEFNRILTEEGFPDAVQTVLDQNQVKMSDVSALIQVDLPPELQALTNLSDIEKGAIFQYTTDMFKPMVSTSQSLGMKSHAEAGPYTLKHTLPWLQAVSAGLKKLPPYPHPVYRVQSSGSKPPIHEQSDTDKQKWLNKYYPIGKTVPFNYPTSTAKSTNSEYLSKEGLNMDMMFKYDKHKSGKDIQAVSHKYKEEEVLFPAGTRFKVTGHASEEGAYKKKGWIHLEEA